MFTYVHSCGLMYVPVCVGIADKLYPLLKILRLSIVCATARSVFCVLCCIPHSSLSMSQKWCKHVGAYVNITYFILKIEFITQLQRTA